MVKKLINCSYTVVKNLNDDNDDNNNNDNNNNSIFLLNLICTTIINKEWDG